MNGRPATLGGRSQRYSYHYDGEGRAVRDSRPAHLRGSKLDNVLQWFLRHEETQLDCLRTFLSPGAGAVPSTVAATPPNGLE